MKQYLITAGIALGVVVLMYLILPPVQKVINTTTEQYGAVSQGGTDSPCSSRNGVTTCSARVPMTVATTTPCNINIGQFGSSTLLHASIAEDIASTSLVTIARANIMNATTTEIMEQSVTAQTSPINVMIATSTDTAATSNKYTFGPGNGSKWLVFGLSGASIGLNQTGICQATWMLLRST